MTASNASPELTAALHLGAVLPALALLAPHDAALRRASSGARPFAVALSVQGVASVRRLAFTPDGQISTSTGSRPGDLRLWFPTARQFLRAASHRSALALPISGWSALSQLRRFQAAGQRLDTLLRDPAVAPELFAHGNLAVGLAAACTWLRISPAASHRTALGEGVVSFACPALPEPHWIDLSGLTSGLGPPPRAPVAEIAFADLATLLTELTHQLDALAALAGGELRIRGHLIVAERLGLILNEVSRLLNPPASKPK